MTEFGYRSSVASFVKPYVWPQRLPQAQKQRDEISQAVAYAVFLDTVGQLSYVKGAFAWNWFSGKQHWHGRAYDFSIQDKLAQRVLRAAFVPRRRQ